MAGQNKSSMRRKLRSALAHKKLADELLDNILATQEKWNATLDKLDADGDNFVAAVEAEGSLATTTPIDLTSVAAGAARNGSTLELVVNAAAANPTDTVLVAITGSADEIVVTVTPNDGTNNAATPVDLTTEELVELINTGAVAGKDVVLTDANSLRELQTAAGGDTDPLANGGEGDGEVATFANGANAEADLATDYEADGELTTHWDPEAELSGQSHATARELLRSALAHRAMADDIADALEEMQVAYTALLLKLDDEAGTLNDGDYESTLAVSVLNADADALPAQHKAKIRRSLRSALANEPLADQILDAVAGMQESFNEALALLDAATIDGTMSALKVEAIQPDGE